MKVKSSKTLPEGQMKGRTVKEQGDTLHEFRDKVSAAQMSGDQWVETSADVIKYFHPRGLGQAKYFWYGSPGVRVCLFGDRQEIEERESKDLMEILHGPGEGKMVVKNDDNV